MRAFSIVCRVDLVQKPIWLDTFRAQFDSHLPYHVTLKNTTFIQHGTESDIEEELRLILPSLRRMRLLFREVCHNLTPRGECIMIRIEHSADYSLLVGLQQMIRRRFSHFGEHIKPTFADYELHFSPHLTIARHLSAERFEQAWHTIVQNDSEASCEGAISSLELYFADVVEDVEIASSRRTVSYTLE